MTASSKTKDVVKKVLSMEGIKDFIRSQVDLEGIDRFDIRSLWGIIDSKTFFRLNFYKEVENSTRFADLRMVRSMFVCIDNNEGELSFIDQT